MVSFVPRARNGASSFKGMGFILCPEQAGGQESSYSSALCLPCMSGWSPGRGHSACNQPPLQRTCPGFRMVPSMPPHVPQRRRSSEGKYHGVAFLPFMVAGFCVLGSGGEAAGR